ncbi:MAG: UDP-N-acetylmuramoyl-L-alanyl-D-glutamate--2,6-diaminopimelate ligase [Deltaproteobacteria bacterium]|nr:UDP-N-acetylmuramoyl-L-alanyl-D-glutamate--2,6-diaminopimelate ligase [Deltaproteobacteria bacterium]
MHLKKLIENINIQDLAGDMNVEISHVNYDSRKIGPGDLFVAMKGYTQDGHDFIGDAVSKGAAAILSESAPDTVFQKSSCKPKQPPVFIQVPDSRKALSKVAVAFYGHPFHDMNLIGITGTNGKTTTSYLLESILVAAGQNPGVIGTINHRISGFVLKSSVTTPESLDLMKILREMADHHATDVIMEVSSHALDQGRVADCPFRTVLFTNISRDHLDYHQSMDNYFKAKSLLFTTLQSNRPEGAVKSVINLDDPRGKELLTLSRAETITYGLQDSCDVTAKNVTVGREGLSARLILKGKGEIDIGSSLIGNFDIYNIMAATSAALSLGVDVKSIASGIENMKGVPGRMELVSNPRSLTIVVDYAHTPDALEKALYAAKEIAGGRILTVLGCGGDRDRGKRVEMGRVAGKQSHKVFITSDNPRSENPAAIAHEIEKGVIASGQKDYLIELQREKAIQMAVEAASKEDLVLIAGKGHEDYQITGKVRRTFDDRVVAAQAASFA